MARIQLPQMHPVGASSGCSPRKPISVCRRCVQSFCPPSPPLGYFILLGFVLLLQGWCAYTQLDCLFLWLLQSVAVCTIKNRIFHNHSPRNLCTQYSPLLLPNFTVKMLLQIHATKLWRCSFVPEWVTNFGHSFRIYRNLAIVKSSLITI